MVHTSFAVTFAVVALNGISVENTQNVQRARPTLQIVNSTMPLASTMPLTVPLTVPPSTMTSSANAGVPSIPPTSAITSFPTATPCMVGEKASLQVILLNLPALSTASSTSLAINSVPNSTNKPIQPRARVLGDATAFPSATTPPSISSTRATDGHLQPLTTITSTTTTSSSLQPTVASSPMPPSCTSLGVAVPGSPLTTPATTTTPPVPASPMAALKAERLSIDYAHNVWDTDNYDYSNNRRIIELPPGAIQRFFGLLSKPII